MSTALPPSSGGDNRLSDHPDYVATFRRSLDKIAADQKCDFIITPHQGVSLLTSASPAMRRCC
jgi:metallo-beta-lactamase class B